MKKRLANYTFDASAKQVVFTDVNPIVLAGILLITNVTDNIIIYNFADPALGGTVATNTLTLTYDTGSMDDADKLMILYDDAVETVTVTGALTDTQLRNSAVPVSLATVPSHAVTNAGTFAVQSTNQANSGTDIGDVTINNSTGAAAVNIQDGGNTITVDNGGTFAVQATLAAETTKVIGTVNLNKVMGEDCQVGGGIEDKAIRVTIANNSTGLVSVDDNGGALTVDGTVAVTQGTASNLNMTEASAGAIKTSVELLDNSVDGNYLNVNMNLAGTDCPSGNGTAATSQRVTIASDSTGQIKLAAGTAGIGKLTANSGVDIGDVDILSIAAGTNIIGKVGHDITTIGHGVKTVTTAGTDLALAASTACKKVDIQAQTDNTSIIAVGASGVDATVATGTGIILYPGDTYSLEIDNLADVFIDSLVSGEGVRFCYYV